MTGFGFGDADRRLRAADYLVAFSLAAVYLVILLATLDIGYTRDESYYFRYAQVYQDWFTDVGDDLATEAPNRSLERDAVVKTWSQNFEHPPLMKTLFGWSWRLFAHKLRSVEQVRKKGEIWTARVKNVGKSEGFSAGSEVDVRGPLTVGSAAPGPVRLRGVVTERKGRFATVQLDAPAGFDGAAFAQECKAAARGDRTIQRGCTAEERGTFAWLSEGSAVRFPALVFSALLLVLIYLFAARLAGRWVAVFSVVAFAALPRGFFHAHLACFDVPVATMTMATLYAFWRSQWSRGWAVVTAVVWGFALLTKHNAFFLPVFLVFYWLVAGRDQLRLTWKGRLRVPPIPLAFLLMPLVGLVLLFALWPKLWFDPARALRDYFSFHLSHDHYMQYYFGDVLEVPPFPVAFPFVMTALTVPVLTLGTFFVGSVAAYGEALRGGVRRVLRRVSAAALSEGERYRRRVRVFLAVNLLLPIVLIALPSTPIFGGVKHWLTAMPFFAILAGLGFDWLRRRVTAGLVARSRVLSVAVGMSLFAVVTLPAVVETARIHPFGTAYYNQLVGGVQGAADARLHRQFWGYATRQTLDRLNREAPARARVYFQNTTHDAYVMYKRDGLLRQDIRHAHGSATADYALFEHQKSFAEIEKSLWMDLGARGPDWQVCAEGVPMISVYRKARPGRTRAPRD